MRLEFIGSNAAPPGVLDSFYTCPDNVFYTTGDIPDATSIGPDSIAVPVSGKKYQAPGNATTFRGDALIIERRGQAASVRVEKCSVKSAKGFGDNLPLANMALSEWRNRGFSGAPYSCASFCREAFVRLKRKKEIVSRCNASANNMLRPFFSGGWIETTYRGYVYNPVYHYDINSAYLSAALKGLPSRLYPYNGDKKALGYVVVLELKSKKKNAPNFLNYDIVLATKDDVEMYGLKGTVLSGVQFYDLDVNLSGVLFELADLPYTIFKRCTQSFWGMYASHSGLDVLDIETGEGRHMHNRFQNICWAALIVRRVAGEVWNAMTKYRGVSCFVDSVLTEDPLPTELIGDDTGQWKIVGEYKKGVYIEAAGVWNSLPFRKKSDINNKKVWNKHAGFS